MGENDLKRGRFSFLYLLVFVVLLFFVLDFFVDEKSIVEDNFDFSHSVLITCMEEGKSFVYCVEKENLEKSLIKKLENAYNFCARQHVSSDPWGFDFISCFQDILDKYPLYKNYGYYKYLTYCLHENEDLDFCLNFEDQTKLQKDMILSVIGSCYDEKTDIEFLNCVDSSILKSDIGDFFNDSIFNLFANGLVNRQISLSITTLDGESIRFNNVEKVKIISKDKSLFTLEQVLKIDLGDLSEEIVWSCDGINLEVEDVFGKRHAFSGVSSILISDPFPEVVNISAPVEVRRGNEFFIRLNFVPFNSLVDCMIYQCEDGADFDSLRESGFAVFSNRVSNGSFLWEVSSDAVPGKYCYLLEDVETGELVYADSFRVLEK